MQNLKNKLIIYTLLCFCSILQLSFNAFADISNPESGTISSVSDKLILSIKDSQIKLELPYLYIPHNLLSNAAVELDKSTANQELIFDYIDEKVNRHGAFNAVVKYKNGNKSLQELLIENGLAFVYFLDSPSDTKLFFLAEENARKRRMGMWHDGVYSILDSTKITIDYDQYLNHFVIVEGVVDNIYLSKKNTYLNFGKDWKTDFSVQFDNKTLKKFTAFTPDKLKGKHVRVRGWLENYNGPFMKIFNPANVEIIN